MASGGIWGFEVNTRCPCIPPFLKQETYLKMVLLRIVVVRHVCGVSSSPICISHDDPRALEKDTLSWLWVAFPITFCSNAY